MSRAEFWRLPPGEIWWLMDAHLPAGTSETEKLDAMEAALDAAIAEYEAGRAVPEG